MGIYLNIGNSGFTSARNDEYVDKSGLIAAVNSTLNTQRRFTCLSRSRRFGKSMAAQMLNAYYDESCDSRHLFTDLQIARDASFEKHLNKYPVIFLDITNFTTRDIPRSVLVSTIQKEIREEILTAYPAVAAKETDDLMDVLIKVSTHYRQQFIMIIDEWDAICREVTDCPETMDKYVNLLRRLFKGSNTFQVFAAVYMTGILPIKKYKTESALNNFWEYSMVEPGNMAKYFGFTKAEVKILAEKYDMDFDEMGKWYDGYQIGDEPSMFNPNSVMQAINRRRCLSYWATTGAFDAVSRYINMNFYGLKDDIILMLAGGRCKVNPTRFQNDMSVINSRDDVLTVLIHLGYLSYDWKKKECYIPNYEVREEMANAIESNHWTHVVDAVKASELLLQATLAGDEEAIARGIEAVHDESTSILSYNNENSLACVLSLAYYYARNDYIVYRELPTGRGFADLVFIPRPNIQSPAIVVELKYDKGVQAAIDQIHQKNYPDKVAQHADNLILVGINYDKDTKSHSCRIERYQASSVAARSR